MIIFPSSSALIFTHFLFSIFYEGLNVFSIFFVFFSAGLEVTDCIPITVVICACLNFVEKLHNQIHITCPANSGARQTSGLGFSEPGTNSGPVVSSVFSSCGPMNRRVSSAWLVPGAMLGNCARLPTEYRLSPTFCA